MQAAGQHFINDDFAAKMTSPENRPQALQLSLNDRPTVGMELMPAIGELAQASRRWCVAVQRPLRKIRRWCKGSPKSLAYPAVQRALNILIQAGEQTAARHRLFA